MALIQSTAIPSGATDYELEQSLKFNNPDNAYLSRTFVTPTNRKIFTFSVWLKRSVFGAYPRIFSTATGAGGNTDNINFMNDDTLRFSSDFGHLITTMKFRDPSAWYHIVYAFDSTQSTEANRLKLYVNGTQVTSFGTANYPTLNDEVDFNSAIVHDIGRNAPEANQNMDGYLAELNWVDGQALTPADFGETGDYGEWKPIEYSGTYGNNGFYLPFKQDYTVEGFSTVTYRGSGGVDVPHYIGGVGFQSDLTWIKIRTQAYGHFLYDSVRGVGKNLQPEGTGAEADTNQMTAFNTDGFTVANVSSGTATNKDGDSFVAWNWDMGADTPTGFNAVTYKGSGSVRDVSGFGFSPDLVWIKSLDHTYGHHWTDSVRGAGKDLYSDTTDDEYSNANSLQVFKPDGFKLGTDNGVNNSTKNYVAWGWDMGNTTATNTSGTISSQVRANTTYGQSIVTYDGNGTNNATVGHGLSSAPELVMIKRTDASTNWNVGADAIGWANHLYLNTTSAQINGYNPITGQASTLEISNDSDVNNSSGSYVAYCFHSVSGYSKFGSYTGNASANGPSVTTGFRPAFLLVKKTTGSADWHLFDNVRGTTVDNKKYLKPNSDAAEATSAAEATIFDFNATGFQVKGSSGDVNGNNETYIYMAFAGGMDSISDYNTDGSIDSRVKANPTYGQSIVSFNGSGGSSATIGHGLSSTPEVVIYKSRSDTGNWNFMTTAIDGSYDRLVLNDTSAKTDDSRTAPTTSVITDLGFDSGTATIAYCFHSVTGYSKFGSYTGSGSGGSPTITIGFRPAFLLVKNASAVDNWRLYDNTRTTNLGETILYPNLSVAEDSSSDSANWHYTVTDTTITPKGSNNNASGNTFIYMAFADKREYAYWLDQSGNNNDWTSNNLTESDISVDSPSNNFATWNPLFRYTTAVNDTYSEGNLKVEDNAGHTVAVGTIPMTSGKWYWEVYCIRTSFSGSDEYGMFDPSLNIPSSTGSTPADVGTGGYFYSGNGWTKANGSYVANPGSQDSVGAGDIIAFAYDVSAGTLKIYVNNSLQKTLTVAAQESYVPSVANSHGSYSVDYIGNFGQDSSFAGNKTAQGNQDGNDIGDFYYTPPTGFLALCTKNLPDVAVVPSEHFNTVLYSGNGSTQSITGVGFQPDFIWQKRRDGVDSHVLTDVIRGTDKSLYSDRTDVEASPDPVSISAFNSDGFTLGANGKTNGSSETVVAWNWKANGSGSSNTAGSINSTVSVNVDAGFSIVSYTGDGGTATVGHGLSKAPEMILLKTRDTDQFWVVYHANNTANPETDYLRLNTTNATTDDTYWNDTAPTSSVFSLKSGNAVNKNNDKFIAYCFHSVDGYSKVGSYAGNSNTDGTFVYTGFKPKMVMWKNTEASANWFIMDSERNEGGNAGNPIRSYLHPNSTAAENWVGTSGILDFTSNGFKYRASNNSSYNFDYDYIYIAFAETPFKYSNAR